MTRDDIERMAIEAGGGTPEWDGIWELSGDALQRFAALVAAAEREACAKVCEETTTAWTEYEYNSACMDCAKAIRARGEM